VQRILNNWYFKRVLAPVAVVWALGWGYFQINYPTCTFRYKLTAEVMTPEGVKSGSSVVEVSYHTGPRILTDPNTRLDTVQGEAVYVDIGQGKNLFITLGTYYSGRKDQGTDNLLCNGDFNDSTDYSALKSALNPIWLPIKIFKLGRTNGEERDMCSRVSKLNDGTSRAVELNNLPTLITFPDISQLNTAQVVDPNDLVKKFGLGHSMAVKIEISNEKITQRIDDILPWLHDQETGKEVRPLNWLALWEYYKFRQPAAQTYILH
jgi:antitoxin component of MazEF toxin-antitoxin module